VLVLLTLIGRDVSAAPQAASGPSSAPTTSAVEIQRRVTLLVRELDDPQWSAREQAESELVALGIDAKPALQAAVASATNDEVCARIESALGRIDDETRNGPSLITLHVKNATVQRVVAELNRQCGAARGAALTVWPSEGFGGGAVRGTITLDADRQPFWLFMRDFCAQSGFSLQDIDGQLRLVRGGTNPLDGPYVLNGPFLICAVAANQNDSVYYANQRPDVHSLQLDLMVFIEPKVKVVDRDRQATLEEATDDLGQSLIPPAPVDQQHWSPREGGEGAFNVGISLVRQSRAGSKLSRLRGSLRVQVETRSQKVEIDKLLSAAGTTATLGHWTLHVVDVKLIGHRSCTLQCEATTAVDPGDGFPQFDYNSIAVVDASGKHVQGGMNSSTGHLGPDGARMKWSTTYSWGDDGGTGQPVKLVWEMPVETRQVDIPFDFADLPLPQPPK
jgi:hypothetical protein